MKSTLMALPIILFNILLVASMTCVRTQMTEHDQPSNDVLRRVEALERAQDECTQNLRHISKLEQLLQDAFTRIEKAEGHINKLERELLERDATEQKSQYASLDQHSILFTKSKIRKSEKRLKKLVELIPERSGVNYTDAIRVKEALSEQPSGSPKMNRSSIIERNHSGSFKFEQAQNIKRAGVLRRAAGSLTLTEVAFHVTLVSANNVFQSDQILTYDTVLYNKGNAYNPTMGTFICPVTGTYYFFANIGVSPNKFASISIKSDGLVKGRAIATSNSGHEQGSTSVFVKCDVGQHVYVEAYQNSEAYGDHYTSFSGFLISREETSSS